MGLIETTYILYLGLQLNIVDYQKKINLLNIGCQFHL